MKNKIDKHVMINLLLFVFLFIAVATRFNAIDVNAAGDWKGYAVFRKGTYDHAGIMYGKYISGYKPVIHAPGGDKVVRWDTWKRFKNGKDFICVSKPKNCNMNATIRNSFVSKGLELRGIPYTKIDQIKYNAGNQQFVKPQYITNLRCDGVLEYIYEWYGYRVGGPDGCYDITINRWENMGAHSGFAITPRIQHQNLLTYVQGNEPE